MTLKGQGRDPKIFDAQYLTNRARYTVGSYLLPTGNYALTMTSPENFEFSAFWDLKMASKQYKMMVFVNWPLIVNHAHINVAKKLY